MIFIPFNTPSSKNSKQWTGKRLIKSKLSLKYEENTYLIFNIKKNEFLEMIKDKEKPYKLGMYFIRDSKRRFDYHNVCQLPLDLMVKHEWLEDDNADEIIPIFLGYRVDKNNPGVQITIINE